MFKLVVREEIWRLVKGYEGYYQVSNCGRIKSLEKAITFIDKGTETKRMYPEGILKPRLNKYLMVTLYKNKKGKTYMIHRLVAKAFPEICGEWFEGAQVHHINFNKDDNRPENLIVLSSSEHSKLHYRTAPDSFKKATEKRGKSISKALTGRRSYNRHTPIIQLTKNGEEIKKWECISDVETELGFSAGNICWCCKGKIKTAYGFKWQYAVNN